MLNLRLIALLEQARTEMIEFFPPLLMGFYKALRAEGADDNLAFDLTSQLFQHYLNQGSAYYGKGKDESNDESGNGI